MGYQTVEELMAEPMCAGRGKCGGSGACREVRNGWKCSGKWKRPSEAAPTLENLFPPGFDFVRVAQRHGVQVRPMRKGDLLADRASAYYDPETRTITINPHLDKEKAAKRIRNLCHFNVSPEDVPVWLFCHELAHHQRRRFAPARSVGIFRPLTISEEIEVDEEEKAVNKLCEDLFYSWKWGRPCGDVSI